jgi:ribosome maturation factor RimP
VVIQKRGRPALLSCPEISKIADQLVEAFERAAGSLPHDPEFRTIEVVATHARRAGRATALSLVIDEPSGVDLALCERVASRINAALEERPEQYTLEVESPGLDRPLLRPADYERFRGRSVRVQTTLAVNGQKTHRGTLSGMRGTAVILATPSGELPLPIEMVKAANLEVDIREDLARAKKERRKT